MPDAVNDAPLPGCGCLRVQAMVKVDDRGQMVLPKDVRQMAGIQGGDKLALTTLEQDGKVCCMFLTKAEDLVGAVQSAIGRVAELLNDGSDD